MLQIAGVVEINNQRPAILRTAQVGGDRHQIGVGECIESQADPERTPTHGKNSLEPREPGELQPFPSRRAGSDLSILQRPALSSEAETSSREVDIFRFESQAGEILLLKKTLNVWTTIIAEHCHLSLQRTFPQQSWFITMGAFLATSNYFFVEVWRGKGVPDKSQGVILRGESGAEFQGIHQINHRLSAEPFQILLHKRFHQGSRGPGQNSDRE